MALHTGAATPQDDDYLAPGLNRLARLLAAAHAGQVLLSLATQDLARDTLPAGASLRDLGEEHPWPVGTTGWAGIGLGDLLFATAGPLVFRKALGRTAGVFAIRITLGAISAVYLAGVQGLLPGPFPVMVVLNPLLVAQYLVWIPVTGYERTPAQYLGEEPHPVVLPTSGTGNAPVVEDGAASPSDA
jgi:hypothetical protein